MLNLQLVGIDMKRLFKVLAIIVVIILLMIVVGLLIKKSPQYRKRIYPLEYRELIEEYSKEYSLDPYLVSAVIWTESRFSPTAKSHRDAMGLMQITPRTGEWAASLLKVEGFKLDQLYEPRLNIKLGCWYLDRLRAQFNGDMDTALAAYNGGSGNVSKWLKDSRYSENGETLSHIPFKETREYVIKVNAAYEEYKSLYDF